MSVQGAKILVIDDEQPIRRLLSVNLKAHGYTMIESSTGMDGLVQASASRPDLVILDLGLPDGDGQDVIRAIREWSQVPIIILTVREREEEKILALDQGADDFVTKPFGMGELLARIRVALRHVAKSNEPILHLGNLILDLTQRLVTVKGSPVKLTPIEYDLLKTLAQNAGRVMTHRQLLKQVWGNHHFEESSHYLRIYIGHLRKKLEEDPTQPKWLITEPGVGYRLMAFDGTQ